jgi:hypothetical protein
MSFAETANNPVFGPFKGLFCFVEVVVDLFEKVSNLARLVSANKSINKQREAHDRLKNL